MRPNANILFNEHLPLSLPHSFPSTRFQGIANWIWRSTSILHLLHLKVGEQGIRASEKKTATMLKVRLWAPLPLWAHLLLSVGPSLLWTPLPA